MIWYKNDNIKLEFIIELYYYLYNLISKWIMIYISIWINLIMWNEQNLLIIYNNDDIIYLYIYINILN